MTEMARRGLSDEEIAGLLNFGDDVDALESEDDNLDFTGVFEGKSVGKLLQ